MHPVDDLVSARLGKHVSWVGADGVQDALVEAAVQRVLAAPLTLSGVVDVALVRNPGLQAAFEGLGLAQAHLVAAGLLEKPSVGVCAVFDVVSGRPEVDAAVELPFMVSFAVVSFAVVSFAVVSFAAVGCGVSAGRASPPAGGDSRRRDFAFRRKRRRETSKETRRFIVILPTTGRTKWATAYTACSSLIYQR